MVYPESGNDSRFRVCLGQKVDNGIFGIFDMSLVISKKPALQQSTVNVCRLNIM